MTWLAALNMTGVDLRFDGSDGLIPAGDFGAVDDSKVVAARGLAAGVLAAVIDADDPEAAVAVARAAALNLGLPPDVEVGLTLSQRVATLTATYEALPATVSGLPARVTAVEAEADALAAADSALDGRLDVVEARPYLDISDGTPTVVSQGA